MNVSPDFVSGETERTREKSATAVLAQMCELQMTDDTSFVTETMGNCFQMWKLL